MTLRKKATETWTIAEARAHLPALLEAATRTPQRVLRRAQPVGVVISPEAYDELAELKTRSDARTLADAFAEIRAIGGELEAARRTDRTNAFLEIEPDARPKRSR